MKMYVIEGLKGSGKTTTQYMVQRKLYELNPRRAEDGGLHRLGPWETGFGQQIRSLLVKYSDFGPAVHGHLILASRQELISTILHPIWKEDRRTGKDTVVIMDRWTDSTLANQSMGFEKAAMDVVDYPNWPWSDPVTFFLNVTPQQALVRRQLREKDSFTITLDDDRAYKNYLTLANRKNHVILDGTKSAEAVSDSIVRVIVEETAWDQK